VLSRGAATWERTEQRHGPSMAPSAGPSEDCARTARDRTSRSETGAGLGPAVRPLVPLNLRRTGSLRNEGDSTTRGRGRAPVGGSGHRSRFGRRAWPRLGLVNRVRSEQTRGEGVGAAGAVCMLGVSRPPYPSDGDVDAGAERRTVRPHQAGGG
jgi:hypothetical protein